MRQEETVDFQIKCTWQNIAKMYNSHAASFGSTMAVGFVLLNIETEGGTPSTALGPKMGMEATSLSRILKSMEEKNLIFRQRNPNDGRSVLIYLTDFGIEKREDARQAVLTFNNKVFERISTEDKNAFTRVIDTINSLIDNREIYADIHETNNK